MANRIVKHNWNTHNDVAPTPFAPVIVEPDKTKTISQMSLSEVYRMIDRIRSEKELENLIRDMKWNSGERDTYEQPFTIDTTTPIDQLYHHGILGMRWGVRRFQNKDGTRTRAGKQREADNSDDYTESRQIKAKPPKTLSNAELKRVNERLQLEETYKRLTTQDMQKSQSWVDKTLKTIGTSAITTVGGGILVGSAKLLIRHFYPKFADTVYGGK